MVANCCGVIFSAVIGASPFCGIEERFRLAEQFVQREINAKVTRSAMAPASQGLRCPSRAGVACARDSSSKRRFSSCSASWNCDSPYDAVSKIRIQFLQLFAINWQTCDVGCRRRGFTQQWRQQKTEGDRNKDRDRNDKRHHVLLLG